MAHEITETDSIAYHGETPWHKIGTPIDHEMTPIEAIAFAGLDWKVGELHLHAMMDATTPIDITTHKATFREDTGDILGVVGIDYTVIQNAAFAAAVDEITRAGLRIDVAGSLFGGRVVWFTGNLPGSFFVGPDQVDIRLTFYTSHDGSKAHTAMISPVRVVCNNTLTMAEGKATTTVRIKHTKNALDSDSTMEVQRILGIAHRTTEEMDAIAHALLGHKTTPDEIDAVCKALIPDNETAANHTRTVNAREAIRELAIAGKGNSHPDVAGTGWSLYNGITEYADSQMTVRTTPGRTADEARLVSTWFGAAARLKVAALPILKKELAL